MIPLPLPENDPIDYDKTLAGREGHSIEIEVVDALQVELSHAFHGTLQDGSPVTPLVLAEIAGNTARVTVLKAFAVNESDSRVQR
jgi:hypothetical protein